MRLSPTCAQVAQLSAIRHTVMVVRGRSSGESAAPSITTASWASAMLSRRKSPASRMPPRWRLKQRTMASIAASAATSPPMCPPMPSATVNRMRVSVTTMDARSWLSLRLPWRVLWAVSTFKRSPRVARPPGWSFGQAPVFSLTFSTRPHPWPRIGISMARSMTGFARRETRAAFGVLVWEVRSVNHRYLDMSLRLPEELRGLEAECRERIAADVKRGKLDGQLRFEPAAADASLQVDEARARAVGQAAMRVASLLGANAAFSPLDVLRWPGVVQEPALDVAAVGEAALTLLKQTLTDLSAARGREGERTA